ncbi:Ig-like domain-containing protein [Gemmatimonadota bacterium]
MRSAWIRQSGRKIVGRFLIPVLAAAALSVCSDDPAGPEVEDDLPDAPAGVTVSDPTGTGLGLAATLGGGGAAASLVGEVTYVSASPGTFADAESIEVTNVATGETKAATPLYGGFDPVALNARPGDEIRIVVRFSDLTTAVYTSTVPERKRPRVVRTIPPNGATDVVLSVTTEVVFSEPVDGSTATTETVQLRGDTGPVDGVLDLSADGLRAWFTPDEPLEEATSYRMVVTTDLLDRQGDALEQEVQATFTTGSGFLSLAAGGLHSCAVRADGVMICWGYNDVGQCGRPPSEIEPPQPVLTDLRFTSVRAGSEHTCGVTIDGEAYCWGYNDSGQLGDGTTTASDSPVLLSGGHTFASLAAGSRHSCGVTLDGTIYCWGRHNYLQLGPGEEQACLINNTNVRCSRVPIRVAGGFASVSAGHLFNCALRTDGAAYCWGGEFNGQLGTDSNWMMETCGAWRCSRQIQQVMGGHTFLDLSSGDGHTCGVETDGAVYCWGNNLHGQLGVGYVSDAVPWGEGSSTPLLVVGGYVFVTVKGGSYRSCALTGEGKAYCWGLNDSGELGNGDPFGVTTPEPVEVSGAHRFVTLAKSLTTHVCGVTVEGDVYCWGSNSFGQLGHDPASLVESRIPILVPMS